MYVNDLISVNHEASDELIVTRLLEKHTVTSQPRCNIIVNRPLKFFFYCKQWIIFPIFSGRLKCMMKIKTIIQQAILLNVRRRVVCWWHPTAHLPLCFNIYKAFFAHFVHMIRLAWEIKRGATAGLSGPQLGEFNHQKDVNL